jgi:hypothetical protein
VAALVPLAGRLSQPVDDLALVAARLGGATSRCGPSTRVAEVHAVASTLDATGARLGQVLDREWAFSADASHQLRTAALAGLRLRLEAARLPPDADQGRPSPTPWPRWTGSRGPSSNCSP